MPSDLPPARHAGRGRRGYAPSRAPVGARLRGQVRRRRRDRCVRAAPAAVVRPRPGHEGAHGRDRPRGAAARLVAAARLDRRGTRRPPDQGRARRRRIRVDGLGPRRELPPPRCSARAAVVMGRGVVRRALRRGGPVPRGEPRSPPRGGRARGTPPPARAGSRATIHPTRARARRRVRRRGARRGVPHRDRQRPEPARRTGVEGRDRARTGLGRRGQPRCRPRAQHPPRAPGVGGDAPGRAHAAGGGAGPPRRAERGPPTPHPPRPIHRERRVQPRRTAPGDRWNRRGQGAGRRPDLGRRDGGEAAHARRAHGRHLLRRLQPGFDARRDDGRGPGRPDDRLGQPERRAAPRDRGRSALEPEPGRDVQPGRGSHRHLRTADHILGTVPPRPRPVHGRDDGGGDRAGVHGGRLHAADDHARREARRGPRPRAGKDRDPRCANPGGDPEPARAALQHRREPGRDPSRGRLR
ncbi:hypothetical protein HRbin12_01712 [bacterium HR12]|nr:hypothetical protein HRbin12_01712 [bacterium HR12]